MSKPSKYQLPYAITSAIVNLVAQISEAVGRLTVFTDNAKALRLRRINRIRTIQDSLAIEGDTLSVEQIPAILNGKRFTTLLREKQEVHNAIVAYDHFAKWRPGIEAKLLGRVFTSVLAPVHTDERSSHGGMREARR